MTATERSLRVRIEERNVTLTLDGTISKEDPFTRLWGDVTCVRSFLLFFFYFFYKVRNTNESWLILEQRTADIQCLRDTERERGRNSWLE